MIRTYNAYHLGDNIIHLNFLRRLGLPATHYCPMSHHWQLQPLVEDTDIQLLDIGAKPIDAVNCWIGKSGEFQARPPTLTWTQWYDYWFFKLSNELEVDNPLQTPDDYLLDYPGLKRDYPQHDYLIINSPPASGQLPSYNPQWFVDQVKQLHENGHSVVTTHPTKLCVCTQDYNMTVCDIGALSSKVKHIIAVDTGPLWPTYNVRNKDLVLSRTVYTTTHRIDLLNTQTRNELQ